MAASHSPTISRTSSTAPLVGVGQGLGASHSAALSPIAHASQHCAQGLLVNLKKTAKALVFAIPNALGSITGGVAATHPYATEKLAHIAFALQMSVAAFCFYIPPLIPIGALLACTAVLALKPYMQAQKHAELTERNFHRWCSGLLYTAWDNSFEKARKEAESRAKASLPPGQSSRSVKINGFEVACNHAVEPKQKWLNTWLLSQSQKPKTPLEFLLERTAAVITNQFQLKHPEDARCKHFGNPENQSRILEGSVAQIKNMVMQKLMHYMPEDLRQRVQAAGEGWQGLIENEYPQLKNDALLARLKELLGLNSSKNDLPAKEKGTNNKTGKKIDPFDLEYALPELDRDFFISVAPDLDSNPDSNPDSTCGSVPHS